MVLFNPLVLVLPNSDCLSFHYDARYTRYTHYFFDEPWACGPNKEYIETVRRCISSMLASFGAT